MNKKGFTLIELLAVLVILGMLIVIAVPNLTDIFNEKKDEIYEKTVVEIERITGQYLVQNPHLYAVIDNAGYADITIETLCNAKIMSCPIRDPRDKSEIKGYVRITYTNDDYVYEFVRNVE